MKKLNKEEINKKIYKIKNSFTPSMSRVGLTLLGAIENGVDIEEEERLFDMVRVIYRSGKHRRPAHIKHEFMRTYQWLRQELGYPIKKNPAITKKFRFGWMDRINIKNKKGKDKLIPQKLEKLQKKERVKILKKLETK